MNDLEQEFDKFAEEYDALHAANIRITGETPDYFAAYKPTDVHRYLVEAGIATQNLDILDFGCGVGTSIPHFRRLFPDARLTGIDVSQKSLAFAKRRFPEMAEFVRLEPGSPLPLADASVDVAFSACVFHHIPEAAHIDIMADIFRVIRPGGWFFVFEHNPLNPLTVRAVDTCPFDENAVLIRAGALSARMIRAGFTAPSVKYRIFFPRALRALRVFERNLTWCPLGAQYYAAARRPA